MKTIIIATDFSSCSLNAAKYAVEMAQTVNAEILLLNVYEIIPNYNEIVIDLDVNDLKKISERDMLTFKNELLKITNTTVNISTEVKMGAFTDELNEICNTIKPYAVIMGSQGKTAAERIIFGNHTTNALKNFDWPLVTVSLTANFTTIKNIGIAYDFKKIIDEDFIAEIKLLAKDFDANIHILNAAKEDEFDGNFVTLSTRLEKMLSPNAVHFHFVEGENINESIIDYAEKHEMIY